MQQQLKLILFLFFVQQGIDNAASDVSWSVKVFDSGAAVDTQVSTQHFSNSILKVTRFVDLFFMFCS